MSESKQDNRPPLPPGGYWDDIGDEEWSEEDLAKLKGGYKPELDGGEPRNQDKTSGQPKDSEK
jgi:hypothetical protein